MFASLLMNFMTVRYKEVRNGINNNEQNESSYKVQNFYHTQHKKIKLQQPGIIHQKKQ
jgi:F0F1-type ATP synthase membrane subunit b/b'